MPEGDGKLVLLERHSTVEANEGANAALAQRTAFGEQRYDETRRDWPGPVESLVWIILYYTKRRHS